MTTPKIDYSPNSPLPKDIFNASQPQFQQNFSAFFTAFGTNHVALDAASNAGNHTNIQLAEQTSQFQTNAGEISAYGKDLKNTTTELYLRYQGNQTEFPYTTYQIYPIPDIKNGNTLVQSTFISFLPGNLLIYFGQAILTTKIVLNPAVCKNIISVNLCGIFGGGLLPGGLSVDLTKTPEGIFTSVVTSPGQLAGFNHFYFIVGNL